MEVADVDVVTPAQWEQIAGGQEAFAVAGLSLRWRAKELHTVGREGARILSHVGLTLAVVEVGGRELAVAGVGGVIVTPPERGRGRLRPVLEAALARAERLEPGFALLFCVRRRVPMYERFGFAEVTARVTVDQPDGPLTIPMATMWRPLRDAADWPDGPVRLRGLPF